jgi:hypothetical protein
MSRRAYLFAAAAAALLAFILREWFVLTVWTPQPFAGDSAHYMRYAYNLIHSGVYSHGQGVITPDDFRTPGYPLFLTTLMSFASERPVTFVAIVRQAQVVVGTLTVIGTMALARQWLPRGASLVAGLLIALWPHHVVATASLLSEVLFGAALVGALLLASLALRRGKTGWSVAGGAAWGFAYLVNPVVALFPVGLLAIYRNRAAAIMLGVMLVPIAAWTVRNMDVPPTQGRAGMNFVQGSWPDYYDSYRFRRILRVSAEKQARIDAEVKLMGEHPDQAWAQVTNRLTSEPGRYLRWYALQKPVALWDWSIQLGQGGIYFLQSERSVFETNAALHGVEIGFLFLNPILLGLLLIGAVALVLNRNPAARICGLAIVYLTAIHVVFQAEPRYAIAYRPLQAIAVTTAVLALFQWRQWVPARVWKPATVRPLQER